MIWLQEKHKFRMIFFSSVEVYGDYEKRMTESVMVENKRKDTYQMHDYTISKWTGLYGLHVIQDYKVVERNRQLFLHGVSMKSNSQEKIDV